MRRYVCRAIEHGLAAFDELLARFHHDYPAEGGDIARFEYLVDQMFDAFPNFNLDVSGVGDKTFPTEDNLDTGNAAAPPFSGFVEAVQEAFRDLDLYRRYIGPRPIAGLREAAVGWLCRSGFLSPARIDELELAVGAGTMNLYDALCRLLIRRPGDIVIIPEVTFGFFIPQVEYNYGHAHFLKTNERTIVDPAHAARAVDNLNRRALFAWRPTAARRLRLYLDELRLYAGLKTAPGCAPRLAKFADAAAAAGSIAELDRLILDFAADELCGGDRSAANRLRHRRFPVMPTCPRVVAYLHINPNLYGVRYSVAETRSLVHAMTARDVSIIEDIAYHSLGAAIGALPSCQNFGDQIYTLIGLSKPLAIANCRLGLMLGPKRAMSPFFRALQSSIGFVPAMLQAGLRGALAESERLQRYLDANWSGPHGYDANRVLLLACFQGCCAGGEATGCEERISQGVKRFFAARRAAGVELYDPNHVFPDGTRATTPREYQRLATEAFMAEELQRWFAVARVPDCGFFLIADCRPLLQRWGRRRPALAGAFDVFALCAVLFGVRTIPEECMGNLRFAGGSYRLRFTYSVPADRLIAASFTLYLGLQQLEALLPEQS